MDKMKLFKNNLFPFGRNLNIQLSYKNGRKLSKIIGGA